MSLIVNGEQIEHSEIEQEAERLRPQYEQTFADMAAETRNAQLLEWSKENVIERHLIDYNARQSGVEISDEEVDALFDNFQKQYEKPEQFYKDFGQSDESKIKENLRVHLRIEKKLEDVCSGLSDPSEDEILAYYERHKADFQNDEQVRVAHIVKYVNWQTDEQTALESITRAHSELVAGEPFEVVVDKHTDCADHGGDLGYVNRGQMVEEFEDVVFNLGVGQVSDVFRTRFGYHIAKVYDRRPPTTAPLEHVRKSIVEKLKNRIREDAINNFIDSLKDIAEIKEA